MKSPFPGMDPYLERHWRDVHQSLVTYTRDALQLGLPSDLIARTEERVYVQAGTVDLREMYPDVRVIRNLLDTGGSVAVMEPPPTAADPVVFHIRNEPMTEGFIQIMDASGGEVITVIEILSLTNKLQGEGMSLYLQKQEEPEAAGVGLVEIDLLRAGQRVQRVREDRINPALRTPYRACVRAGWETMEARYYPMPLRRRLSAFHVPLRKSDEPVLLDLQALVDQVYRNGRYDRTDYRKEPLPPLDPDDAQWADELLRAAGKR